MENKGDIQSKQKEGRGTADQSRMELADHMARVLTGQKSITPAAPEPEELNRQAQTDRAWREGYRGHNWPPRPKSREELYRELFKNPILKVAIVRRVANEGRPDERIIYPGDILVDRLEELWEREGVERMCVSEQL